MEKFYSHDLECMVQQINKTAAKKRFENGETIFLQSSKMLFDNVWQSAFPINIGEVKHLGETLETICNSYLYYNCDKERGKYIHFFVRVEDTK